MRPRQTTTDTRAARPLGCRGGGRQRASSPGVGLLSGGAHRAGRGNVSVLQPQPVAVCRATSAGCAKPLACIAAIRKSPGAADAVAREVAAGPIARRARPAPARRRARARSGRRTLAPGASSRSRCGTPRALPGRSRRSSSAGAGTVSQLTMAWWTGSRAGDGAGCGSSRASAARRGERVGLLVGMIGAAHQRPRLDVAEAEVERDALQARRTRRDGSSAPSSGATLWGADTGRW